MPGRGRRRSAFLLSLVRGQRRRRECLLDKVPFVRGGLFCVHSMRFFRLMLNKPGRHGTPFARGRHGTLATRGRCGMGREGPVSGVPGILRTQPGLLLKLEC